MDDLLATLNESCARCLGVREVAYCAAWGEYLCVNCRAVRNTDELRVPVAEHVAVQEPGRRSTHVAIDLAYLKGAP